MAQVGSIDQITGGQKSSWNVPLINYVIKLYIINIKYEYIIIYNFVMFYIVFVMGCSALFILFSSFLLWGFLNLLYCFSLLFMLFVYILYVVFSVDYIVFCILYMVFSIVL